MRPDGSAGTGPVDGEHSTATNPIIDAPTAVPIAATSSTPIIPSAAAAMTSNGKASAQNGFSAGKDASASNGRADAVVASSSSSSIDGTTPSPPVASSSRHVVSKVTLPGTTLYPDAPSSVNREELIRLMIQTLRDVGYTYVHPTKLKLNHRLPTRS